MPPTITARVNFEPLDDYLRVHRGQLLGYIASALPRDMQRFVAPEDIFQDLCIRAHGSWPRFRGHNSERVLRSWVYKITDRAVIDVIRKPRLHIRGESGIIPPEQRASSMMDVWSSFRGEDPTPDELLSAREIEAEVQLAISKLSEQQAKVIYMRLIEGLSRSEIAERLGKTKDVVNNSLHAGKKKLSRILKDLSDRRQGSSDISL